MAGLLVQRDRRVIMGALDWLPVKYEGFAKRRNGAVVAHTHIRTHRPDQTIAQSLKCRNMVFHVPLVMMTVLYLPIYTDVSLHLIFSLFPGSDFYTSDYFYTSRIKAHNYLAETITAFYAFFQISVFPSSPLQCLSLFKSLQTYFLISSLLPPV